VNKFFFSDDRGVDGGVTQVQDIFGRLISGSGGFQNL
jgi:hypothetical protein